MECEFLKMSGPAAGLRAQIQSRGKKRPFVLMRSQWHRFQFYVLLPCNCEPTHAKLKITSRVAFLDKRALFSGEVSRSLPQIH